jgi:hypothetical protein
MWLQQEALCSDLESSESILWARLQSVMKHGSKLLARIQQLESEKASLEAFFIEDGETSGMVRWNCVVASFGFKHPSFVRSF